MLEGACGPLPHKQMVTDNPSSRMSFDSLTVPASWLRLAQSAEKIAAAHVPFAPTMPSHQLLAYEAARFCRISCMS